MTVLEEIDATIADLAKGWIRNATHRLERLRRRVAEDDCKHAEQRSVEREEVMESKFAHLDITTDDEGNRVVGEYEGWKNGQKIRVIDDAEEDGPFAGTYAGDEGTLRLDLVGAAEYGNERVDFGIITEHFDEPVSVDPENIEGVE